MSPTCVATVFVLMKQPGRDRGVRQPFPEQAEHPHLALGELAHELLPGPARHSMIAQERRDHVGIV